MTNRTPKNQASRAPQSFWRHPLWGRPAIGIAVFAAASAALLVAELTGCRQSPSPGTSDHQAAFRRLDRGESLLKAAAAQLNDLPAGADTQLRPPVVILDSTKSSDGNDVLATFTRNARDPAGRINYVTVPVDNARFGTLGVRSGDILKYYILEDETVDPESRAIGFTRRVAMEFIVAQVLDDNKSLLVEGGLNTEITTPEKMEIWRYTDERLPEINRQLRLYRDRRLPPLGWEPSPDAKTLAQVVVWLNQWLRQSEPKSDWRLDPLLETVDAQLRADELLAPHISSEALERSSFEEHEGRLLQEAVWLRDIARWARGDGFDNLQRATALFDWTIRNVQLEPDDQARAHRPWQVLLYGRGTAEQRAWVFALLARQLDLDVVVLALPATAQQDGETPTATNDAKFWLPALLDNGELYLFDTRLGLPLPGRRGSGVATLKQVQDDGSLLRQLDLDGQPYPVTSAALEEVVAYIVADPFDLTRRARQLEAKLTGDDRLALSAVPSLLAARLKELPQIEHVQLWPLPFETLREQLTLENTRRNPARLHEVLAFEPFAVRPFLWKARTRHFQGRRQVQEETSAVTTDEPVDDHREAARLYTSKSVRPSDRQIEKATSDDRRRVDNTAKLNATYWVGLMSYDDGKFDVAAHWFAHPELQDPASPWSSGARYNLARTYEAQGKLEEAAELLEEDGSPQSHGNRLRARRLRSQTKEAPE